MATITAAAGGGLWSAGGTWVGGVKPGAGDDVLLTGTSGNVTIDTGALGRSLNCTGYTGTLTHNSAATLTLGDATAGLTNVALKLVSGMTYTLIDVTTSAISFVSTSATQQTITTGGKSLGNWTVNGAGSSYLLGDANTIGATATLTLTAGTLDTGNFACSWGLLLLANAGTKTITLGSSVITITGGVSNTVLESTATTHTSNTAVMTFTGVSATLNGGSWNGMGVFFACTSTTTYSLLNGPTVANVTVTGGSNKGTVLQVSGNPTITGTFTVTTTSTTNRILVFSSVAGTTRTISVGTSFSFSNVDFQDITAAGAAGTWTGTSMGNALGNTNITFDSPATQTHTSSAGGNWSDVTKWTSRVPLPQDNVIVDVNTTGTLTVDMPRLGADVTFSGFAGTAAFSSVANSLYGGLILGPGMTLTGTQGLTLSARSSKTLTSNGKTFTQAVNISAPGGTYSLVDAFVTAGNFNFNDGIFTTNNNNMTASTFGAVAGTARVLNGGSSTFTITSVGVATVWELGALTAYNMASSTIVISGASSNGRLFSLRGANYGTITYTVAGSTGSFTFQGGNGYINTLNFSDASNARSLLFTAGTTTTVSNFNVVGTAGKLMTIDSATAATHTLSYAAGIVSTDYLSVKNSTVDASRWYAGANSTNVSGNTNWTFTAPPTPPSYVFSDGLDIQTRATALTAASVYLKSRTANPSAYDSTFTTARSLVTYPNFTPMIVDVTLSYKWNALAHVEPTVSGFQWSVLVPVSPTVSSYQWSIIGTVSPSVSSFQWNALAHVEPTVSNFQWNALAHVEPTVSSFQWTVLSSVSPTVSSFQWNALAHVEPTVSSFQWTVLSSVSPTVSSFQWNALSVISPTVNIFNWGILLAVGPSLGYNWTTLAPVGPTADFNWGVLGPVEVTPDFDWNVHAILAVPTDYNWNVAEPLTQVDASPFDALWNVLSVVDITKAYQWQTLMIELGVGLAYGWNVAASVDQIVTSQWNVLAPVSGAPQVYQWDSLGSVSATSLGATWGVLEAVGPSMDYTWGTLGFVGASLNYNWNMQAALFESVSDLWNVLTILSASKSFDWTVLRAVSSNPVEYNWLVLAVLFKNLGVAWRDLQLDAPYIEFADISILDNSGYVLLLNDDADVNILFDESSV